MLSMTHCTGMSSATWNTRQLRASGRSVETAHEKAPQRVILANGGEHFPEEGGLDDDVHRHVVLVRPVDGMDGPLVHHEDFSGPQGDLLLVVDKVMGFAGDHVHHFDVVMAMPGKRREPRVRPQKDHLARGHDLSAVDAEVPPSLV